MDTPTHVAAAGVASQVVFALDERCGRRLSGPARLTICVVACVVLGVGSHLALDALPHYNFVADLPWLPGVPYHWLVLEALVGLMVFIPILYLGRDRRGLVCVTVLAAMYPDFEKTAYHDFGMPRRYVVFPGHTFYLSSRDWGLPHPLLIAFEMCLLAVLLLACWQLAHWRRRTARVGE